MIRSYFYTITSYKSRYKIIYVGKFCILVAIYKTLNIFFNIKTQGHQCLKPMNPIPFPSSWILRVGLVNYCYHTITFKLIMVFPGKMFMQKFLLNILPRSKSSCLTFIIVPPQTKPGASLPYILNTTYLTRQEINNILRIAIKLVIDFKNFVCNITAKYQSF